MFDLSNRRILQVIDLGIDRLNSISFSSNSRYIAMGGGIHDGRAAVWDLRDRRKVLDVKVDWGRVFGVGLTSDPSWLVAAGDYGRIQIWDIANGQSIFRTTTTSGDGIRAIAISPRDGRIVAGDTEGSIFQFSPNAGSVIRAIKGKGWITSLAFSSDGSMPVCTRYVEGTDENAVEIREGETGALLRKGPAQIGGSRVAAISAESGIIASASVRTDEIEIWRIGDGQTIQRIDRKSVV